MKRLTIEIDKELHAKTKAKAYSQAKTIKQVILELLEKWQRNGSTK